MNIVIVNGSPRKGNTLAAISAFAEGASQNAQVEIIDAAKLNIGGCNGCEVCQCHLGCVAQDDTNATVDKLVAADLIVWATPVYWWGVTAQLKLVIDKCYCRGAQLKNKAIGLVLVGGASTEDGQYDLIKTQFDCMCQYLGWDMRFFRKFSAYAKTDLSAQADALADMKALGQAVESC